jgi:hypothetical protein
MTQHVLEVLEQVLDYKPDVYLCRLTNVAAV